MSNTHKREFVSCIIDAFEDFLDKKGVRIENPERDADDPNNEANLWGSDYDDLMDNIIGVLTDEGINVAEDFNGGEDGNVIRLRNEFYTLICQNSSYLPEVGCFNVTLTDGSVNETYETQGDKSGPEYSWEDFWEWLLTDIFEIYGIDQPNQLEAISIADIQFAGTDNLCSND